jgi:hypothetical protein
LEYWQAIKIRQTGKDVVYKSIPDLYVETGLSRHQQDIGVAALRKENLITMIKAGHNIRHFHVHVERVEKFVSSVRKNDRLICEKAARKSGRKPHTITIDNQYITNRPRSPTRHVDKRNVSKSGTERIGDTIARRDFNH